MAKIKAGLMFDKKEDQLKYYGYELSFEEKRDTTEYYNRFGLKLNAYDQRGILVYSFDNITEAAKTIFPLQQSRSLERVKNTIRLATNDFAKHSSAYGYIWFYNNVPFMKIWRMFKYTDGYNIYYPIEGYDRNTGILTYKFDSPIEAAKVLSKQFGGRERDIVNAIEDNIVEKNKSAYDCIWVEANSDFREVKEKIEKLMPKKSKPITGYDLKTNEIKLAFSSIKQAAEHFADDKLTVRAAETRLERGVDKEKEVFGYIWRY